MAVSEENIPYFDGIIRSYFSNRDTQRRAFLILAKAVDDADAVSKLNAFAQMDIFTIPTPSPDLQAIIDGNQNSSSLVSVTFKAKSDISNLNMSLVEVQDQVANLILSSSNYAVLNNGKISINYIPDLSDVYLTPSNIAFVNLNSNLTEVQDQVANLILSSSNYAVLNNGKISISYIPDLSGEYLKLDINSLIPLDAFPSNVPNTTLYNYAGLDGNGKISTFAVPDLPNNALTHYASLTNGKISVNVVPDLPSNALTHYASINSQGKLNATTIPDVSNTTFSRYAGLNDRYKVDQSVIPDLDVGILTRYASIVNGKISISIIPDLPVGSLTNYASINSIGKLNATTIPDVSNTTFSRYAGLNDQYQIDQSVIPDLDVGILTNYAPIINGKISAGLIPNLPINLLTNYATIDSNGKLNATTIPDVSNTTFSRYAGLDDDGYIQLSVVPGIPSNKIISGTLNVNRIPKLDASIIDTYGSRFSTNQIPLLNATFINLEGPKLDSSLLPLVYNSGEAQGIYAYLTGGIDPNIIVEAQIASANGMSIIFGNCAKYIYSNPSNGLLGFCSSNTDTDTCELSSNNDHLATCIGMAMKDLSVSN